jgi:hypothetical protein
LIKTRSRRGQDNVDKLRITKPQSQSQTSKVKVGTENKDRTKRQQKENKERIRRDGLPPIRGQRTSSGLCVLRGVYRYRESYALFFFLARMWSSFFLPLLAVLFPPISFSRPLILSTATSLYRSLPLLSAPRSSSASMICRFVGLSVRGGTRGPRCACWACRERLYCIEDHRSQSQARYKDRFLQVSKQAEASKHKSKLAEASKQQVENAQLCRARGASTPNRVVMVVFGGNHNDDEDHGS